MTKGNHEGFVCRNCLTVLTTENALKNHTDLCFKNKPCATIMPEKRKKNILEFKKHFMKT